MLHGLGDCTPERHCGCLSEEPERAQEMGGAEGRGWPVFVRRLLRRVR